MMPRLMNKYISNPEQDNKFMEYVKNLEEQQLKEEQ